MKLFGKEISFKEQWEKIKDKIKGDKKQADEDAKKEKEAIDKALGVKKPKETKEKKVSPKVQKAQNKAEQQEKIEKTKAERKDAEVNTL